MLIYTVILFALFILASLVEEDSEKKVHLIVSFLIFLPLFGRIFGWW